MRSVRRLPVQKSPCTTQQFKEQFPPLEQTKSNTLGRYGFSSHTRQSVSDFDDGPAASAASTQGQGHALNTPPTVPVPSPSPPCR